MNPLNRTLPVNEQCPMSLRGVVPDEIWIKIISIIESNSTPSQLMDNPCRLVCKTFNRLRVRALGKLSQLPFLFHSSCVTSKGEEGQKMEIGNYLTPIYCDQLGNRYFRSGMKITELHILRVDGSFDVFDLLDAFDLDLPSDSSWRFQLKLHMFKLKIFDCTRHDNDLIVVSSGIITLFKLDPNSKVILNAEGCPEVSKSISVDHAAYSNIFLYQNRLFWRDCERNNQFFMCDLSKEKLVWEELELKDSESKIADHATFMTLKGDLYLSYTINKKLNDTCTIQTTNFYIRLNYDSEHNTLTPSDTFNTIFSKPFDHVSEVKKTAHFAMVKGEAEKYKLECEAANKTDRSGNYLDTTPHSEYLLCPNNQKWMVDVRQHKLQVIDLETTTEWIGGEANIISPDPLMQEMVFLDNNFLLVSYSNSFRAFYLPTRTEVTGRLKSFLKPFLKKGYSILSVTFKKEWEEEKEVITVCLQQIKAPRTRFTSTLDNYDGKPESQEVIPTRFTLKEADLLNKELLTEIAPPKIEDPIEESSSKESEKEAPVKKASTVEQQKVLKGDTPRSQNTSPRATEAPLKDSSIKDLTQDSRCKKITQIALLAFVSIAVIGATLVGIFALIGHASWAPQFMKSLSGALTPAYLPYIFISTTPIYLLILAIGYAISTKKGSLDQ